MSSQLPQLQVPESEVKYKFAASESDSCEYAEAFDEWVVAELQELDTDDLAAIHRMIFLLTSEYHHAYKEMREAHRARVNNPWHRCVVQVFHEAYDQLMRAKLKLDPLLRAPSAQIKTDAQPERRIVQMGTLLGLEVSPEQDYAE